jgi:GABA permease
MLDPTGGGAVPRYLVVANLTLGGDALLQVLRERVAKGGARFHVFVPASHGPEGWRSADDEQDTGAALARMTAAMERFRDLGATEVTGQVGTARVVDAVGDVIRANTGDHFDEIILSTLPAGPSRWLAMDLPSRIARAHAVPMTHVVAREA